MLQENTVSSYTLVNKATNPPKGSADGGPEFRDDLDDIPGIL